MEHNFIQQGKCWEGSESVRLDFQLAEAALCSACISTSRSAGLL